MTLIVISGRGTITNPKPRMNLHWVLYGQILAYLVHFVWNLVGMIWTTDPDVNCHDSHRMVVVIRILLLINVLSSCWMTVYLLIRSGLFGICYRKIVANTSEASQNSSAPLLGQRLSLMSIDSLSEYNQPSWKRQLRKLSLWTSLQSYPRNSYSVLASILLKSFTCFEGYVQSDIVAGLTLLGSQGSKEKVGRKIV